MHYLLDVPADTREPLVIEASLNYRKFDTLYLRYFLDDPQAKNDLPVTKIASDSISLPIAGTPPDELPAPGIPAWQRWNDYGIGLLLSGDAQHSALRQAEQAFAQVEALEKVIDQGKGSQ